MNAFNVADNLTWRARSIDQRFDFRRAQAFISFLNQGIGAEALEFV